MPHETVLDVFSGRPNPHWQLSPEQERELRQRVDSLPPGTSQLPQPAGLGYRGVVVHDPAAPTAEEGLRVFGGIACRNGELLHDPDRALERWLLSTAPPDLPGSVRDAVARAIGSP